MFVVIVTQLVTQSRTLTRRVFRGLSLNCQVSLGDSLTVSVKLF